MVGRTYKLNNKQLAEFINQILSKYIIGLLGISLACALAYIIASQIFKKEIKELLMYIPVILVFAAVFVISIYFRAFGVLKKGGNQAEEEKVSFDDNGFRLESKSKNEKYTWDEVTKIVRKKSIVMLYTKRKRILGIPKEIMEDKEVKAILERFSTKHNLVKLLLKE